MPETPTKRTRTARTTIAVAGLLVLVKAATWMLTGSGGVLGSALDSLLDLLASLFVLWAVIAAQRPPDAGHPWGHGKAEGLASLLQSVIILFSAAGLTWESIRRFDAGDALEMPLAGIAVMLFSIGVTVWWVRHLRAAARATNSPALEADSAHYASDVLLNVGVIAGLGLSALLDGARWPDLVVSLGIAVLIFRTAVAVFRRGVEHLMDSGLHPEEALAVLEAVGRFAPEVAGFHDLRSRRSGSDVFLEIHLDLDRKLSFPEAHDLGERVRRAIEGEIRDSRVTVHTDPL